MSTFTPLRKRRSIRTISITTLVFFLPFSFGCSHWRPSSISDKETSSQPDPEELIPRIEPIELVGKHVRFHIDLGIVEMRVDEVSYPYARGIVGHGRYGANAKRPYEVDLRDVSTIEIRELDGWKTLGLVVVVGVTIGLIIAAMTPNQSDAPSPPPPSSGTGGSCPLVYMQQGDDLQLVGELYAGAIYRSLQRTDLLALPNLPRGQASIVLANKARETQYTDLLELLVVDHNPGTRAVSTVQQEILLVGEATHPIQVTDLSNADRTEQTSSADGVTWKTDMTALLRDDAHPSREGLIATFAAPLDRERQVLELLVANTRWGETTIERLFALTGEHFDSYVEHGNETQAGPWMQQWCKREGVLLNVEMRNVEPEDDQTWEHVAYVSPIGAAGLRHVAVPLPMPFAAEPGNTLAFRVTGATGFWEIDQLALSGSRDEVVQAQHVAVAAAIGSTGIDERSALTHIDQNYQVLGSMGEACEVVFHPTVESQPQTRSAFLLSSGYYNFHRPIGGTNSVARFMQICDEPGGLAGFSVDLYKAYYEVAKTFSERQKVEAQAE